ncbi:hypothetical protein [Thermoactinomyces mirandus]|uniref:Uncharacterized protein n=1 Tax=Thermoactinomyces mirandus TaxID=2756294 RepID=A0A7W2ASB6_9BACL|nr:hypothetical protein [Thermoactinomyces mirandus]MBA4602510.1 hypothetical protein [Thermoactinomyces mirandus]
MDCCPRRRKKVVCVVVKRRRRRICSARVDNAPETGAQSAGLINLNLQIPINLGDATTFCNSSKNSVSNLL